MDESALLWKWSQARLYTVLEAGSRGEPNTTASPES